ncbi:alpha/beta fold hydrolase [Antrihabitans spumae]|uniref:Alpha/beta fold hydrolase n=1 Tax=Antrihabitans spumae TaxID=3373370 RepID=A0ABW7KAR8_9NOCA
MQWLFATPTVEHLAARMSKEATASPTAEDDSSLQVLLPLRTAGHLAPLFCVHPMFGLAWNYSGLAPHLDSQRPIYGLQTPVALEQDARVESITALAARYVEEIRSVQPHGPYHLLGWSLGGVIAHAMATRLQADGEDVQTLVMLDSTRHTDPVRFRSELVGLLAELGIDIGDDDSTDELSIERAAILLESIPNELVALTPERVQRMYAGAARSLPISSAFEPAVFDGDLLYFSAADEPDRECRQEWQRYVSGNVVEIELPCGHADLLSTASVAVIGPILENEVVTSR